MSLLITESHLEVMDRRCAMVLVNACINAGIGAVPADDRAVFFDAIADLEVAHHFLETRTQDADAQVWRPWAGLAPAGTARTHLHLLAAMSCSNPADAAVLLHAPGVEPSPDVQAARDVLSHEGGQSWQMHRTAWHLFQAAHA